MRGLGRLSLATGEIRDPAAVTVRNLPNLQKISSQSRLVQIRVDLDGEFCKRLMCAVVYSLALLLQLIICCWTDLYHAVFFRLPWWVCIGGMLTTQ